MQHLSKVTLVAIDCYNYGEAIASLQKSMQQCKFAAVKFLTDIEIEVDDVEVIQIPTISSKEEYSDFVIKKLDKYFDTDFVLVTQHDGWVIDGDIWDDNFYSYDYIGAPWIYTDGKNVGNGGFSLRSKKLQNILSKDWEIKITSPEDEIIARLYRNYLEYTYQIKFAPEELAHKFSYELNQPKQKTFGFHGNFHYPYKPYVLIKRTGAIGDVLLAEPIMKHFASNGYNVVLDTLPEIYELFSNHSYYIEHKSNFDRRGIVPEKVINLDMSYESKPKQNRLKTYFEFAGIKNYKLSRPSLFPLVDNKTKLFKKYVILHIDKKSMPYRNVFGVNWEEVKDYLESFGYSVIQVGKEEHESIGLEMNTPSIAFLKFLIAGCDMFIGIDSGPLNIAMAYNKRCIGFFGSVNPEYVFPDLNGLEVIQQPCVKQHCYHNSVTTVGTECEFNKEVPPCCISDTEQVINKINKIENGSRIA